MKLNKGDRVAIVTGYEFLNGLRAEVVRVSAITGSVTVRLLEGRRAWSVGQEVNLKRYEVRKEERCIA